MANRGFRPRLFGNKRNQRRKNFGRPELEWAIGDENPNGLTSETPDHFALSTDTKGTDKTRYTVDDSGEFSAAHRLIQDKKAAAKYGDLRLDGEELTDSTLPPLVGEPGKNVNGTVAVERRESTSSAAVDGAAAVNGTTMVEQTTPANSEPPEQLNGDVSIFAPNVHEDGPTELGQNGEHRANVIDPEVDDATSEPLYRPVNGADPAHRIFRPASERSPESLGSPHVVQPVIESLTVVPVATGVATESRPAKSHQGLRSAYAGDNADKRVESVRLRLDKALEAWWGQSELPSTALLRDGLLVLEAGHTLEEVHRTLLLRSALAKRRGLVTALRHQTDPDRSAFLIKDALLDSEPTFKVSDLRYLATEDDARGEWIELLLDELHHDLPQLSPNKQSVAQSAIRELEPYVEAFLPPVFRGDPIYDVAVNGAMPLVAKPKPTLVSLPKVGYWNVGRVILAILMAATVATTWSWLQGRTVRSDMVTVPAGSYVVGHAGFGEPENGVTVGPYAIDSTEVTNASYQRCYEQGDCSLPTEMRSATREPYFLNPAFGSYPVVYIDSLSAEQYCAWAGKRLPTDVEWEIAASSAPATNRHFVYPWGDGFNNLNANSMSANVGDTQPIGSYYGVGTSSVGAEDMAGNVAEWTKALLPKNSGDDYIVKGGSYLDPPERLRSSIRTSQPAAFSAPWLGFRCAKTLDTEN